MHDERWYARYDARRKDATGLTEQERARLADLLPLVESDTDSPQAKRLRFAKHLYDHGRISEWGIIEHDG